MVMHGTVKFKKNQFIIVASFRVACFVLIWHILITGQKMIKVKRASNCLYWLTVDFICVRCMRLLYCCESYMMSVAHRRQY